MSTPGMPPPDMPHPDEMVPPDEPHPDEAVQVGTQTVMSGWLDRQVDGRGDFERATVTMAKVHGHGQPQAALYFSSPDATVQREEKVDCASIQRLRAGFDSISRQQYSTHHSREFQVEYQQFPALNSRTLVIRLRAPDDHARETWLMHLRAEAEAAPTEAASDHSSEDEGGHWDVGAKPRTQRAPNLDEDESEEDDGEVCGRTGTDALGSPWWTKARIQPQDMLPDVSSLGIQRQVLRAERESLQLRMKSNKIHRSRSQRQHDVDRVADLEAQLENAKRRGSRRRIASEGDLRTRVQRSPGAKRAGLESKLARMEEQRLARSTHIERVLDGIPVDGVATHASPSPRMDRGAMCLKRLHVQLPTDHDQTAVAAKTAASSNVLGKFFDGGPGADLQGADSVSTFRRFEATHRGSTPPILVTVRFDPACSRAAFDLLLRRQLNIPAGRAFTLSTSEGVVEPDPSLPSGTSLQLEWDEAPSPPGSPGSLSPPRERDPPKELGVHTSLADARSFAGESTRSLTRSLGQMHV